MRIVLFGTGSALSDFLSIKPEHVEVVGLSDNDANKQGKMILGHRVYAPESLRALTFDFVVITSRSGEIIRNQLVVMGIDRQRILLYSPSFDKDLRIAVNHDIVALNNNLTLGLHPIALCTMPVWPEKTLEIMPAEDDFCRIMAIRLAAERIIRKNIPGAVAELGVYRGDLACALNWLFPDRTLYLFDTFEGFSEKDLSVEQKANHSQAAVGDFQNTNVDLVLSRMTHPEKVVVRKGYFPSTLKGLEDSFVFVSLDVDLYQPTASGLEYFYPRLIKGGCMFIHDYNNRRYMGVRSAVDEFVDATGASLVQLPDFAGTVVLAK
ncbi:MAG: TylF/MycF/NovP-related O-methyltransferase [Acidobacteriaceae bacterium]